MVDQTAIEDRGREMGLRPRRHRLAVTAKHGKIWQEIAPELLQEGDIWVHRGEVYAIDVLSSDAGIIGYHVQAGEKSYPIGKDEMIRVFGPPR